MAPVNPEGQTARDVIEAAKRLARKDYIAWGDAGGPNQCSHNRAAGVPCPWCDLATVVCCDIDKILPTQPSEGQTAQEPKTEWRVIGFEGERTASICTPDGDEVAEVYGNAAHLETAYQRAVAICAAHNVRALASTPSPIQTQSTKEEVHAGECKPAGLYRDGHDAGSGSAGAEGEDPAVLRVPAFAVAFAERVEGIPHAGERPDGAGDRAAEERGADGRAAQASGGEGRGGAGSDVAPSPAKQTEQKIASAEGAASQLGAAPAAFDQFLAHLREHGIDEEGSCILCERWIGRVRDPDHAAAPAQPDARDAEIARLRPLADRGQLCAGVDWHFKTADALRAAQADAARLTKELEEARAAQEGAAILAETYRKAWQAAIAPPEPKAETPAETAGQKEGP